MNKIDCLLNLQDPQKQRCSNLSSKNKYDPFVFWQSDVREKSLKFLKIFISNYNFLFYKMLSFLTATPLGQVPALEYDGVWLSQSLTIARFLAKEFGLAGKNNLEQAQADMVIDAGNDLAASE